MGGLRWSRSTSPQSTRLPQGRWSANFMGSALRELSVSPCKGNGADKPPDGHGAVQWRGFSKKATLCLLLVPLRVPAVSLPV
jgi:hypothetical protein